tara:strand:+ start:54623 stop:55249 length:627 start_codon:yes stop_codon:yes gene_type:complete
MFADFCPLSTIFLASGGVNPTSWWSGWFDAIGPVTAAVLIVALCVASWTTNLIAVPGNWIAVAMVGVYVWLGPDQGRVAIGGATLVVTFVLALVGEMIEFAAGAFGAQRAGASRRATAMAMVGSIVGAIVGAVVGLPVPVIGSVLAAMLFGGLGATAGAMYGHWSDGKPWKESWTIGHAAFWGRTLGTLGKMFAGLLIVIAVIAGVML